MPRNVSETWYLQAPFKRNRKERVTSPIFPMQTLQELGSKSNLLSPSGTSQQNPTHVDSESKSGFRGAYSQTPMLRTLKAAFSLAKPCKKAESHMVF